MPVKTSDIPVHAQRKAAMKAKLRRRANRTTVGEGKTFEDLTPVDKDALLKELLIRAGLIEDSD